MLGDGREWLFGERPGLADVHGLWVFDQAVNMAGDTGVAPEEAEEATWDARCVLGEPEFPKVHAWVRRFREACEHAERRTAGAKRCGEGQETDGDIVRRILSSGYAEPQELSVDEHNILGLKMGQRVTVAPAEFGATHADIGVLVGLSRHEIVIEVEA